jgi:hypothetical protein
MNFHLTRFAHNINGFLPLASKSQSSRAENHRHANEARIGIATMFFSRSRAASKALVSVIVDPRQVVTEPSRIGNTQWDDFVVEGDLALYLSANRCPVLKGTPILIAEGNRLLVTSGAPFLHAAQSASPPLEAIVCAMKTRREAERLRLPIATYSELEARYGLREWYDSRDILFFDEPLSVTMRQSVEDAISRFYHLVDGDRATFGEVYRNLGKFDSRPLGSGAIVEWSWQKLDTGGSHQILFYKTVIGIDRDVAGVRSVDGFRIEFYRDMVAQHDLAGNPPSTAD